MTDASTTPHAHTHKLASAAPRPRRTRERQEIPEPLRAHLQRRNSITVRELFDLIGVKSEPPDGVHDLLIESVTAQGGRIRLHLSNPAGERCDVPIGRLADRRTLNRNLRLLLGSTDFEDVPSIRDALAGKHIRARLDTFIHQGKSYRGLRRP